MRAFIAIELPERHKQALERLCVSSPCVRRVPASQLHLTLAFIREVDRAMLAELVSGLASIRLTRFALSFSAPGCFPDRRHPRVWWAGLKPEPLLAELAARVRVVLLGLGISQEERSFSPHITLARLKGPALQDTAHFLAQRMHDLLPPIAVEEFILFESCLTSAGAIHTPLHSFPLMP